jgi:hypothetical protein
MSDRCYENHSRIILRRHKVELLRLRMCEVMPPLPHTLPWLNANEAPFTLGTDGVYSDLCGENQLCDKR